MFKKGTKLYSVFNKKCPHCHEGDFFEDNNSYNLKKVGDVRENCEVCKRKLMIEPGFYYGAMYVAYALAVATYVSIYVATLVLYPSASTGTFIALIVGGLILASPYLYTLSKIIWGNFFIAYKGVELTEKEKKQLEEERLKKEAKEKEKAKQQVEH